MNIFVTGATGFIGRFFCEHLLKLGFNVLGTGREPERHLIPKDVEWVSVPNLESESLTWDSALSGVDAVVHLAGMAHQSNLKAQRNLEGFNRINHLATRSLAEAISRTPRIKHFIFVSSIAVHGTPPQMPVSEETPLAPNTPYGESKLKGEQAIRELLDPQLIRWAILRPVLVYGPGNPGNMAKLLGIVRRGVPIPVGRNPNLRSLLYVGNLADAMSRFLTKTNVPSGRSWVISDVEPISTEALIRLIAEIQNLPQRTLPLHDSILKILASIGDTLTAARIPSPWNTTTYQKFLGDFYVDSNLIYADLGWTPPYTTREGIIRTISTIYAP